MYKPWPESILHLTQRISGRSQLQRTETRRTLRGIKSSARYFNSCLAIDNTLVLDVRVVWRSDSKVILILVHPKTTVRDTL